MNLKLPNSVFSKQDLWALLLEVREYARWFSHESIKNRVGGKQPGQPSAVSSAASELLNSWAAEKPLTVQSLDELISSLLDYNDSAPIITITLAAPAPTELKQTLTAWCRENIAANALVTFKFNSTQLGGLVLQYGSHLYDWSFRRQILANRQKFPEVLRRV